MVTLHHRTASERGKNNKGTTSASKKKKKKPKLHHRFSLPDSKIYKYIKCIHFDYIKFVELKLITITLHKISKTEKYVC